MDGYIKLHRKLLDNPVVCKDSDHIAVWIYLLLNASHKKHSVIFKGERIDLLPGQLITGRKSIAQNLGICESKVQRILKSFEIEQQIEQQKSNKNRLVTLLNWCEYQESEHQNEQQLNNKRTTSEQQLNTNKNVKNDKNVNNNPPISPQGVGGLQKVIDDYTDCQTLRLALSEFVAMRKRIKKPLSERALQMVLARLDDLGDTDAMKQDLVNQSVLHCWQTVYPLHRIDDRGTSVYTDNVDHTELERIMHEKYD